MTLKVKKIVKVKEFLSPEEVAGKLGIHPNTVRRYLRRGEIPAIKLDRIYRIRIRDLEAFIQKKKREAKK